MLPSPIACIHGSPLPTHPVVQSRPRQTAEIGPAFAAPIATVLSVVGEHGSSMFGDDADPFQSLSFARPAIRAVFDDVGIRHFDRRLSQARAEQEMHLRFCQAAQDASAARRSRQAAGLVASAVAAGLTGGLNFGAFAQLVLWVHAAMNSTSAGWGTAPAGLFSATAAGRQIALNLLGALPGSLGYAVTGGLTATLLRPLIDAAALLLSCGRLTPVVAVDTALVFPIPSPADEQGRHKSAQAYTAELWVNAGLRAAMAERQAKMLDLADQFNLKFGTPAFAACHSMRVMYQTALSIHHKRVLAAASAGGLSALSSAGGSFALQLTAGTQRLHATVEAMSGQQLPLFLSRADLKKIRNEPALSKSGQLRADFAAARRAFSSDMGLMRRLAFGVPASSLAVYAGTAFINVMLPLGAWLADRLRAHPSAAVAAAGAVAVLAFVLTYWSVCKALRWSSQVVRKDPLLRKEAELAAVFSQSLLMYAGPCQQASVRDDALGNSGGNRPPGLQSVEQIAAAFDAMNRAVLDGLSAALREGQCPELEPGAHRRMREAYCRAVERVRPHLLRQAPSDAENYSGF